MTLLVSSGENALTMTVPLGAVMTTVVSLTFVFVLGTETWVTMGVVPGVNDIVTDALG